jgi:hypothetical protein
MSALARPCCALGQKIPAGTGSHQRTRGPIRCLPHRGLAARTQPSSRRHYSNPAGHPALLHDARGKPLAQGGPLLTPPLRAIPRKSLGHFVKSALGWFHMSSLPNIPGACHRASDYTMDCRRCRDITVYRCAYFKDKHETDQTDGRGPEAGGASVASEAARETYPEGLAPHGKGSASAS